MLSGEIALKNNHYYYYYYANDFTSNPLGANSTVFASSPRALNHVSVKKEVNAIIFYKR